MCVIYRVGVADGSRNVFPGAGVHVIRNGSRRVFRPVALITRKLLGVADEAHGRILVKGGAGQGGVGRSP